MNSKKLSEVLRISSASESVTVLALPCKVDYWDDEHYLSFESLLLKHGFKQACPGLFVKNETHREDAAWGLLSCQRQIQNNLTSPTIYLDWEKSESICPKEFQSAHEHGALEHYADARLYRLAKNGEY